MADPIVDVKPTVAPVVATPVVPTLTAQPTPAAVVPTGVPPVQGVKPEVKQDSMVPLPALQEERGKRQALEAEVADLRRQFQNQQQYQQQAPSVQQVDPRVELEKLWEHDPRKAVQVEIMYAMDWRDRTDASLEVQADNLARRYPDFNNYRSTALSQVRSLPLNQRGQAGILEAAYQMVRGQNVDTLLQQREAEWMEKYRRGEISAAGLSTPAGSFSSPASPTGIQLDDQQRAVAAMMKMTPEQYAAHMPKQRGT